MNCFKCCKEQKCGCCPQYEDEDDDITIVEDGTPRIMSLRYSNNTPRLDRPKSIDHGSMHNMDELMDLALSQQRVTIFVPISRHIEFSRYIDYLNATTVIHPFSTFRLIWDSFIMLILIFTCFEIPFTLCFGIETSNIHTSYGQFILCIDIILCCDVALNFRTAFYHKFDELRLVSNPYKIAIKYLKRWFFIDFITSFPFEFLFPSQVELGGAPAMLRALRIVRMIRLFKLVRFFRMLKLVNTFLREAMGPRSTVMIRLMRLVALMVLAAHFAACLWFYVGMVHYYDDVEEGDTNSWLHAQNVDIDNKWDAYLVSMYWSIVTLFTTGYGDIIPVNKDEQCMAAFVVLLGTCFFAYLIGAVGSLVAEGDRVRSIRESKLEEAQAFCANKHLPPKLSRAIITHIQYFWKRNFVYDEYEILQCLPFGIQYDILRYYGNKIFGAFAPFNTIPDTTKGLLALKLKQFSCNKGFTVYKDGDVAKEFYIQRTGQSCLINTNNKNSSPYDRDEIDLNRGDICGHIGFVKGQRKGTLFCKTWSEFYSLSRRDLEEVLMMEHPQNWEQLLNDIKKCMKLYKTKRKKKKKKKKDKHKQKLSIDLNQIKQKRNSKFFSLLFAEDSVTRNDKILFEHAFTEREQMEGEIRDQELNECHIQFHDQLNETKARGGATGAHGYVGGEKIVSSNGSSSDSSDSSSTTATTTTTASLVLTSNDDDDDGNKSSASLGRTVHINNPNSKRNKQNKMMKKKRKVGKQGGGGGRSPNPGTKKWNVKPQKPPNIKIKIKKEKGHKTKKENENETEREKEEEQDALISSSPNSTQPAIEIMYYKNNKNKNQQTTLGVDVDIVHE